MTEFILKDGRGCWLRHTLAHGDTIDGATFTLAGQAWRSFPFTYSGRTRDRLPVYESTTPAIGPPGVPFVRLYLPAGWRYPW